MKVKTVPLGELIELCDERNTDNKYGLNDWINICHTDKENPTDFL